MGHRHEDDSQRSDRGLFEDDEVRPILTRMAKVDKKTEGASGTTKKPFDKKKWRENKYSHKAKVDKFKEKRDQSIQNKYFRMLKKSGSANTAPLGDKKKPSFKVTKLEFERRKKKAEKMEKAAEKKRQHEERVEALKNYKIKKEEKFKVLSRKTKRGQPVMAARMEIVGEVSYRVSELGKVADYIKDYATRSQTTIHSAN